MSYRQCHLPNLNNSNFHQWLAAVEFQAAALNIVPQTQDREYQRHAILHHPVMILQSAMIDSVPTEIASSLIPPVFRKIIQPTWSTP